MVIFTWTDGPSGDTEPIEGCNEWHMREPDRYIADLIHFPDDRLWRVNMAKVVDGEMVLEDHQTEDPGPTIEDGLEWGAQHVIEFIAP